VKRLITSGGNFIAKESLMHQIGHAGIRQQTGTLCTVALLNRHFQVAVWVRRIKIANGKRSGRDVNTVNTYAVLMNGDFGLGAGIAVDPG